MERRTERKALPAPATRFEGIEVLRPWAEDRLGACRGRFLASPWPLGSLSPLLPGSPKTPCPPVAAGLEQSGFSLLGCPWPLNPEALTAPGVWAQWLSSRCRQPRCLCSVRGRETPSTRSWPFSLCFSLGAAQGGCWGRDPAHSLLPGTLTGLLPHRMVPHPLASARGCRERGCASVVSC